MMFQQWPGWRVARIVAAMLAGSGLAAALGLAAQVLLARTFGAEALGEFMLAVTVSTALSVLGLGGLHWFENDRRVVQNRAAWEPDMTCWFCLSLPLAMACALGVVLALGHGAQLAALTAAMLTALVLVELAMARLQVQGRFGAVGWMQSLVYVGRIVAIAFGIALASISATWWMVAAGQFLIAGVLVIGFQFPGLRAVKHCGLANVRRAAPELLPLAGIGALQVASSQLDRIVVVATQGAETIAFYTAAAGFLLLAELVPKTAAMRYLLPKLARDTADEAGGRRTLGLVAGLAVAGGLAAAIVLTVGAPWLVRALFGPGFDAAGSMLGILAWALPWRFLRIALDPYYLGRLKLTRMRLEAVLVVASAISLVAALLAASFTTFLWVRVLMEVVCALVLLGVLVRGR